MKKNITLSLFLLISYFSYSQCNGRYENEIFSSVSVNTVNYSDVYNDYRHEMDIYTPDGDTEDNRPVVIYTHGGSFYAGDKGAVDCVDFCTSMAKRGYVAISANYRLSQNPIGFIISTEEQYRTVLKSVFDIKAAIRYLRKEHASSNPIGIDPNAIYVGGYSAGGVLAIHLAYIDQISDLPTSPVNAQNIVSDIGGTLEGDGGNNGFSSEVNGIFSYGGGINNLDWINVDDEPIASVHGTNDQLVNYNCAPGLGLSSVLNLCGAGEMHSRADSIGLYNQLLTYQGEDHSWCQSGNNNPLFVQATQFVTDFLFTLLPCNPNSVSYIEKNNLETKIYPNPSYGTININSNELIRSIRVFNSIGAEVFSKSIRSKIVQLNNLDPGVHLILLEGDNNKKKTHKISFQ